MGKVYKDAKFEVVSLDNDPRWGADIQEDILTWKYWNYPPGYFHTIACGLPCTEFSLALTTRSRNLELADRLALKTLEIVDYFKPQCWWLENPLGAYFEQGHT